MGRRSTGIITIGEAYPLQLKDLILSGAIRKGEVRSGSLSWTDGTAVDFKTVLTGTDHYIELRYWIGREYLTERVQINSLLSNLGKGGVLYFVCPVSFRLCRTLYRGYGSQIWKSRQAYGIRLYYPLQLLSKVDRDNSRYWYYERKLEEMYNQRQSYSYRGKPTKRLKRIEGIEQRRAEADERRFSIGSFPVMMQKLLNS